MKLADLTENTGEFTKAANLAGKSGSGNSIGIEWVDAIRRLRYILSYTDAENNPLYTFDRSPKVAKLLTDNKKSLLAAIEKMLPIHRLEVINILNKAKVPWVELKTIESRTLRDRVRLLEPIVNSIKRKDFDEFFYHVGVIRASKAPGDFSVLLNMANVKDKIESIIFSGINAFRLSHAKKEYDRFTELGAQLPPFTDMLDKSKTKILKELLGMIRRHDTEAISRCAGLVKELRQVGVQWPELSTIFVDMLDQSKTNILKEMLGMIRRYDTGGIGRCASLVKELRQLGVRWPELSTIEKSLAAGRR